MRSLKATAALFLLTAVLAAALSGWALTLGVGSSEAQQDAMQNCPLQDKWAISVWDGADGSDAEQALATCGEGAVAVAYSIDPDSQMWSRWFAGRPAISTLTALNNMQGVIALGGAGAPTSPSSGSSAQQDAMHNCPLQDKWAISVWTGDDASDADQALATCGEGAVAVAYSIDPDSQMWSRWFAGRPAISTLTALDNMQGVLALGSAEVPPAATPSPTPTSTPTPTPTPTPTLSGSIAFVSDRDDNDEIYVMNADGTAQTRLTDNLAGDWQPDWSPDGSKIAHESDRDDNGEVYVMNADGTAHTNVTKNSAGDWGPAWSPDGSQIAFASERDGNGEIYVMNADGTDQTNRTNDPADDYDPAWSP